MIYARSGSEVMQSRTLVTSPGSGLQHWGAQFFGPRYVTTETSSAPQALMTDMSPDETILAHFHGVSQFQVFAGGAGKMARHDVNGIVVQPFRVNAACAKVVFDIDYTLNITEARYLLSVVSERA